MDRIFAAALAGSVGALAALLLAGISWEGALGYTGAAFLVSAVVFMLLNPHVRRHEASNDKNFRERLGMDTPEDD